jgi:hypothetical protein
VSDREEDEEQPDFLENIIGGPPTTAEAKAKYVDEYLAKLHAIRQAHSDDPLRASERTLSATTAFVAGLSPPGSFGPADLFRPLLEVVLSLQWGASLDKTTLFKCAPSRGRGRPPTGPSLMLGQARVAAIATMLMEGGLPRRDAARLVAGRLERLGVRFDRSNADPVNTVEYWRDEAMGQDFPNTAYRDALTKLQAIITPENAASRQQVLLRALDDIVAQGAFE